MFYASSDRFHSPLLDYNYVQPLNQTADSLRCMITHKVNNHVHELNLMRKDATGSVSDRLNLHREASAESSFVLNLHHHGMCSTDVSFSIAELCPAMLRNHVESTGVRDEDNFWRWASQVWAPSSSDI